MGYLNKSEVVFLPANNLATPDEILMINLKD